MNKPRPAGFKVLAAVLVLTAAGTVLFWVNWFVTGDFMSAGSACYRVFENTFPLPDLVMSIFMVLAAIHLLRASPRAILDGSRAAGMALFLASLDTLWHLQHGGYSDPADPEFWPRVFISAHCYTVGAVTLAYLWRRRADLGWRGDAAADRPAARTVALAILALYAAAVVGFWAWRFSAPDHLYSVIPLEEPCQEEFQDAFWFADALTVLSAIAACAGLARRRAWAIPLGIVTASGWTFAALGFLAYYAWNRAQFGQYQPGYLAAVAASILLAALLTFCLWRQRPSSKIEDSTG